MIHIQTSNGCFYAKNISLHSEKCSKMWIGTFSDTLKSAQSFSGRQRRSPFSGIPIYSEDRLKFNTENTKNIYENEIWYFICFCSPDIKRLNDVAGFNHVEKHIVVIKSSIRNEKRFKQAIQEMIWS